MARVTMTRIITIACLSVGALSCTQVPTLERDVCGNFVVESGEDCDGVSTEEPGTRCGDLTSANACYYTCENDAICPDGWGCGNDGRCREPSRTFVSAPGMPQRFSVQSFAIGEVDGDGYLDLIGNQGSLLSVRFGSQSGEFTSELDVVVPQPTGFINFGFFNDDERLDAMVPIDQGLVALLGQPNRDFNPVPYSSVELSAASEVRILGVEAFIDNGDRDGEILILSDGEMRFFESSSSSLTEYLNGHTIAELGDDVAVADIDGNGLTEFVLAFREADAVFICEGLASDTDGDGVKEQNSLQPICSNENTRTVVTTNPVGEHGTRFADVDGDGDQDLLISVAADEGPRVEVAFNDAGVLQDTTGVVSVFENPWAEWPLAAADFNRDNLADYVFANRIAISVATTEPLPPNQVPDAFEVPVVDTTFWESAAIADMNGDGWLDLAVNFGVIDGIDVYLNGGEQVGGGIFSKFHIDTVDPAVQLRPGDFDGDLIQDVAFFENGFGSQEDRISVIFGNASGGPSEPVSMGAFGNVEFIAPILSPLGLSGFDVITDLVVVSSKNQNTVRSATILQGDTSRRMLSPFFLANSAGLTGLPRGALFGRFSPETASSGGMTDVLALAENPVRPGESRVWLMRGTDGTGDLAIENDIGTAIPEETENVYNFACAAWIAGDLDPTDGLGIDEVVGIDQNALCPQASDRPQLVAVGGIFERAQEANELAALDIDPIALGGTFNRVHYMQLRDMDGDNMPELIAAFLGARADGTAAPGAGAAAVVLWNQGGTFGEDDFAAITLSNEDGQPIPLYGVTPIQLVGDSVPELAIRTPEQIRWAKLGPNRTYELQEEPLFALGGIGEVDGLGGAGEMRASDVNADGLDDLVFTVGSDVMIVLQTAIDNSEAAAVTTGDEQ